MMPAVLGAVVRHAAVVGQHELGWVRNQLVSHGPPGDAVGVSGRRDMWDHATPTHGLDLSLLIILNTRFFSGAASAHPLSHSK